MMQIKYILLVVIGLFFIVGCGEDASSPETIEVPQEIVGFKSCTINSRSTLDGDCYNFDVNTSEEAFDVCSDEIDRWARAVVYSGALSGAAVTGILNDTTISVSKTQCIGE